jgi:hypothetical protein
MKGFGRFHAAGNVSSAESDTALGKLETILADHVQDEETEQFPASRRHLPHDDLGALAGKVKPAPTRPHPGAPDSELFHKAVGPGVRAGRPAP